MEYSYNPQITSFHVVMIDAGRAETDSWITISLITIVRYKTMSYIVGV